MITIVHLQTSLYFLFYFINYCHILSFLHTLTSLSLFIISIILSTAPSNMFSVLSSDTIILKYLVKIQSCSIIPTYRTICRHILSICSLPHSFFLSNNFQDILFSHHIIILILFITLMIYNNLYLLLLFSPK